MPVQGRHWLYSECHKSSVPSLNHTLEYTHLAPVNVVFFWRGLLQALLVPSPQKCGQHTVSADTAAGPSWLPWGPPCRQPGPRRQACLPHRCWVQVPSTRDSDTPTRAHTAPLGPEPGPASDISMCCCLRLYSGSFWFQEVPPPSFPSLT